MKRVIGTRADTEDNREVTVFSTFYSSIEVMKGSGVVLICQDYDEKKNTSFHSKNKFANQEVIMMCITCSRFNLELDLRETVSS